RALRCPWQQEFQRNAVVASTWATWIRQPSTSRLGAIARRKACCSSRAQVRLYIASRTTARPLPRRRHSNVVPAALGRSLLAVFERPTLCSDQSHPTYAKKKRRHCRRRSFLCRKDTPQRGVAGFA